MKFHWLPVIVLGLLTFTQARGQIFNVQMTTGNNGLNGDIWSASVSPLAYTGTTWSQSYGGNLSDIPDSNNNSSTVSYTLASSDPGVSNGGSSSGTTIVESTAYGFQADLTLTISGLQDNQTYNLYLVSAYDGSYGGTFTIGSSPALTSAGDSALTSFVNGQNYVEFTNITPSSNEIVVTDSNPGSFAMLNGFQLEAAVPEPSTYAMIFGGLGMLVLISRLRGKRIA